ncbi:MAG: DNA repair protein RadA, partial [Bacteroidota bacterium]
MAKTKTAFFCQSCGYESPKWVGKCPSCTEWNTLVEETVVKPAAKGQPFSRQRTENIPVLLTEIQEAGTARIQLKDSELNRVLGGGLVLGEIILIGGDPGIGKSTL